MKNILFLLFLIILSGSCKKAINQNTDNVVFINNTLSQDSIKKENKTTSQNNAIKIEYTENLKLDSIKILSIPLGSKEVVNYKFPKYFGQPLDDYDINIEQNIDKKTREHISNYKKSITQNLSYLKEEGSHQIIQKNIIYPNLRYFPLEKKNIDSFELKNTKTLGKIIFNERTFLFRKIEHNQLPKYKTLLFSSLNDKNEIIDEVILFEIQHIYLGTNSELFYLDNKFIITKVYISGFEGEFSSFGKEQYQISPEGYFIPYYQKNGILNTDQEAGEVKHNTREGKWIEKKQTKDTKEYVHIEAEYKSGIPIGIWNYYRLKYKNDHQYNTPKYKEAKKGELLYTETYKEGELVERIFVK